MGFFLVEGGWGGLGGREFGIALLGQRRWMRLAEGKLVVLRGPGMGAFLGLQS